MPSSSSNAVARAVQLVCVTVACRGVACEPDQRESLTLECCGKSPLTRHPLFCSSHSPLPALHARALRTTIPTMHFQKSLPRMPVRCVPQRVSTRRVCKCDAPTHSFQGTHIHVQSSGPRHTHAIAHTSQPDARRCPPLAAPWTGAPLFHSTGMRNAMRRVIVALHGTLRAAARRAFPLRSVNRHTAAKPRDSPIV